MATAAAAPSTSPATGATHAVRGGNTRTTRRTSKRAGRSWGSRLARSHLRDCAASAGEREGATPGDLDFGYPSCPPPPSRRKNRGMALPRNLETLSAILHAEGPAAALAYLNE